MKKTWLCIGLFLCLVLSYLFWVTNSFGGKKICPEDKPLFNGWGCDPCSSDRPNEDERIDYSESDCKKCPNRVFENGFCLFKTGNGELYMQTVAFDSPALYAIKTTCYYGSPVLTSKSNCDECPNRVYKDGYCIMNEKCPESFIQTKDGSCLKCDEIDDNLGYSKQFGIVSEAECLKCAGWRYDSKREACFKQCPGYPDNRCPLKCEEYIPEGNVFWGEDHTIEQPKLYRSFSRGYGYCWSCDEPGSVRTAKVECDKCAAREYDEKTGACKFKGCPEGFIMSSQGKFCSDPKMGGPIGEMPEEECSKYPGTGFIPGRRIYSNGQYKYFGICLFPGPGERIERLN